MTGANLLEAIHRLGLSTEGFARLVGVTTRAVNLWLSEAREVPGPVEAYVRLLGNLPAVVLAQELARLRQEDPTMYEGMYAINFEGAVGTGEGVLVLQGGVVFGHDGIAHGGGVVYDGTYAPALHSPGMVELRLHLTVPPNVALVQGVPPQRTTYTFDITCTVALRAERKQLVDTPFGKVAVSCRYLRDVPSSRAA